MPVHHLLEQILNEYVEAAGLRSGQPLFQSVNSAGTAVTGRTLNRATPGLRFESGPGRPAFSLPLDVTPGGQPGSPFTWRTTDVWSTPSRWWDTSPREQPNFTTDKGRDYTERGRTKPSVKFVSDRHCGLIRHPREQQEP
jgi:hypothetical protein